MGFTLFPTKVGLTGLIVASTVIILQPFTQVQAQVTPSQIPPSQVAPSTLSQVMAQANGSYSPVGCRITREQIGVYQEPNLTEAALGVLAEEVTIALGTGSGNGWARIVAPETGWVQAKFLRGDGATPCPAGQTAIAPQAPAAAAPAATAPATTGQVSRAVCAVLPEAGLIVRDQPNLVDSRIIGSIRPGNYTFQFTSDRRELGEPKRQWAYITAPAKGWVSTGIVGGGANLSGEGCS